VKVAAVEAAKVPEPAPVPDSELSKEELKQRRKDEKKRKRREEKVEAVKKARSDAKLLEDGVDERAGYDPRFASKTFAAMFLKPGEDDAMQRKSFASGISTKPLSAMSYL
jgi:hypothetical protein